MNRDQKAAVIDEIAAHIKQAEAVFAVDYRGISVPQAAELRARLRDADATFRIVKNSLTERAADAAGAELLKGLLEGPTALTFVHGDAALAAKAIADAGRTTQLLPFKGGLMNGEALSAEQIGVIARLPARQVLYGQLTGLVASPVSGLVRTLNALIGGLAVQLGAILEKKQSGEVPAGEPPAPAAEAVAEPAGEPEPADEAAAETEAPAGPADEAPVEAAAEADAEPAGDAQAEEAPVEPAAETPEQPAAEPADEASAEPATEAGAEPGPDAETGDGGEGQSAQSPDDETQ
jgi:large subunit ribosomal protein L10